MVILNEEKQQIELKDFDGFSLLFKDLKSIVLCSNWKMSLACFQIIAQDSKYGGLTKEGVSPFEYEMAETFIRNCTRTTFPEHR